ncbi:hypothetical protein FOXB_06066, partial [Fusarium oxysporum f. sp. conglutinans Fo5176]
VNYIIYLY